MDSSATLDAALTSSGVIRREDVLAWLEQASDLIALEKLYRLTDTGYARIQPELGKEVTCGLIRRFLLECIRLDAGNDESIPSRFEAAGLLHQWYLNLLEAPEGASDVLTATSAAVTELFLAGDPKLQNAIETGFLEHALETEALRPYFAHWAADERLREAWEGALEWGNAHPNFMSSMLNTLRAVQERYPK